MWDLHVSQHQPDPQSCIRFFSASGDRTIKVWTLRTSAAADGQPARYTISCMDTLPGHRDAVYNVASWADGRFARFVAGSVEWAYGGPFFRSYYFPFFSFNFVSASADTTVRIWQMAPTYASEQLRGHTTAVVGVATLSNETLARWAVIRRSDLRRQCHITDSLPNNVFLAAALWRTT